MKMNRQYYSSRNNPKQLSVNDLYQKIISLYLMLRNKDYFKSEAGITASEVPDETKHKAVLMLDFQPFPIEEWTDEKGNEDNLFDIIEYLYDVVSKPGSLVDMTTDTGWNYTDYDNYDPHTGRAEYISYVNAFLCRYRNGYELTKNGTILSIGNDGVQVILQADIPILGEEKIDKKIEAAILKWRNRQVNISERREAIRELADVFEWLKKSKMLREVLSRKDESALFDIANNFAIRHHNPYQQQHYDEAIWFSWMFHFYLATYHAVARMIAKKNHPKTNKSKTD